MEVTSTPKRRFIRSQMTSTWTWLMPATIVSPVCGSRWTSSSVFLGEPAKRLDDLVFVALGLGLDGEAHERRGELDLGEAYACALGVRVSRSPPP